MKPILSIFRKDLRRYWRETAVSIVLLAVYAWNDVKEWAGESNVAAYGGIGGVFSHRIISRLVVVLLPAAWAFLIVRLVQGEALVGDRQFWITRPYEWKKLLAAKILFVALTINLPLLLVDIVLLARAGFPPAHYVTGLLWMQVLISLTLILPIATLATVTASVVQSILAVLGIVLYMIGVAALVSVIPSSSFSDPADSLELGLLVATCVAVILCQYARRNTAASRWLIAGLAVAVVLIVIATPYNAIVNREFPRIGADEHLPVQFALLPPEPAASADVSDNEVEIQIPLSTSGIADDSIVVLSGVLVSLDGPRGWRWNSGWQSPGTSLFPDQKNTQVRFTLRKRVFDRIKSDSVRARISIALTVYLDQNRKRFVTPQGEFSIPEVGFCTAAVSYLREIHCRAPLRTPSSLLISSDLSKTTCSARDGESRAATSQIVRYWTEHSDSGPAELGISPVKTLDLFLWSQDAVPSKAISGICPGTPLTLSRPEFFQRTRTELELDNLRLADYRLRDVRTDGSFWFVIR